MTQNCNFFTTPLSCNYRHKRLKHKENKTKYSKRTRSLGAILEFYYIERGLFQSSSDLLYKHRRPKLTLRENVVM